MPHLSPLRRRPQHARQRRRAGKRRPARRWRWLGLGALVVAVAAWARRVPPGLSKRNQRPLPSAKGREPESSQELPDDVDGCWIPGPAGTLHVLERHPNGVLPVVFIHGLGGRAQQWSAQFHAAGPAIRAVALDLPGHGRSDPAADGDYSLPAMAAAIGAAVDGLGLRRVVLIAHSLGASAAIEYAGSHRRRVAGLLMVDPSGDQTRLPETHGKELLAQLNRDPDEEIRWYFRQLLTGARPEVADRVLEDLAAVPAEVILNAIESALSTNPLPALERFGGPARSVISDFNDLPYSLHNLLPDLPVCRFAGAGHWLMLDRPTDLWAVIVDFLDEIRACHPPVDMRSRPGSATLLDPRSGNKKLSQHIDKYR